MLTEVSTKSTRNNIIKMMVIGVLAIAVIAVAVLLTIVLVKATSNATAGSFATTSEKSISCKDHLGSSVTFWEAAGSPTRSKRAAKVQKNPDVNVPTLPPISSNSPKYNAYMDAVNQLKIAINTSADPCNDFWGYACGSYPKAQPVSFDIVSTNNFVIQAKQMMKKKYQGDNTPLPLKQTVWFFKKCSDARKGSGIAIQDSTIISDALKAFQNVTGLPFPMLNQNIKQTDWPSAIVLGTALGYLSGVVEEDTLISSHVDINWLAPRSATPYYLYVDQSSLIFDSSIYAPGMWEIYNSSIISYVQSTVKDLTKSMGLSLNSNTLKSDTMDIVNFELALARNFSTDDTTKRDSLRSSNPTTVTQAQSAYPFIDWTAYFKQLSTGTRASVQEIMNNPDFTFSVMETDMLSKLSQSLVINNAYGFTPRQLVNYLAYRLVLNRADYSQFTRSLRSLNRRKLHRPPLGKARYIRTPKPIDPQLFDNEDLEQSQLTCMEDTMDYLMYANARFFIDALYSDKGTSIRQTVGAIITSVVSGFQSMIDQLPWMDATSKASAYGKITNLVKNIAFPDFIIDDNQLAQYYSDLNIVQTDDYKTMLDKLSTFSRLKEWDYLAETACSDRYEFGASSSVVNAWYQPQLNSITFPAGILQPPFFHPAYPASLNYGGLGVIAGHELTHGFDDEGVQWDGVGKLAPWMSNFSKDGFQRLANCVINEYNGFCPYPSISTPRCVKGSQTQGENIADNGGIHAAWRAYKTYAELNGPDPRLPDPVLGQFTHDQLFFLGFAHVWCEQQSKADVLQQMLTDPHSPSKYRVFGTIQNIPAFQNAFNCPSGSKYAPGPDKHCNIWVVDN